MEGERGPFIFNLGEGAGGIRRVAPVGYDDHPLHKKVFGHPPPFWPHPMPCPPPPPAVITLIDALFFSSRAKEAKKQQEK